MNELWAWEYEEKTEYGERFYRRHEFCRTFNNKERDRLLVTNLRKVKVVDEDVVVFDKKVIDRWNLLSEKKWNQLLDLVKLEIEPTPPVTEPKNFGAIVEAQYHPATLRTRFFFNGADWIRERTLGIHDWSYLINPIIISEGVE